MFKKVLACAALIATAISAFAQDGTGVQAGPFRVKPTVGLTLGHDNNVGQSRADEVSSFFWTVSPGIRFDSGNEARSFSLSYELDATRYTESRIDDYNDQRLNAGVKYSPTVRNRIGAGVFYERGHDRRGLNARQGEFANLTLPNSSRVRDIDKWDRKGVDVDYAYGAPGARGLLGFGAGVNDLEYRNNREYSAFGDRQLRYVNGKFGFRIAPKTSAFVSAMHSDIQYDRLRESERLSRYTLDSSERVVAAGLQFDATAITSGKVSVGRLRKNFDDARINDYSGTVWDVGLQYRVRSYSLLDFTYSRGTQEAVNFLAAFDTDFLLNRTASLAWSHSWTDRFQSGLDFGVTRSSFVTDGDELRDDDLQFWGLSADYRVRDWLSVGAGYKSYQRESDSTLLIGPLYDYDRDEISITLEASL